MKSSMKGRVAIIQFPGVNCEYESADAVRSIGLEAGIFRWNEDPALLDDCAGIILPGGFSYQDRIRAGVVAAKDRIMDSVSELARRGKPVLGICNGAQVLVESGLIPGIHWEKVDLALAPNVMADREGYYCAWVHLRKEKGGCLWTRRYFDGEIFPIPIAHAEGRFVTEDERVLAEMKSRGQIALRYCDPAGVVVDSFPVNPNGSVDSIAGVSNVEGNVLAMMPHPERSTWLRQVPEDIGGQWGRSRRAAAGEAARMEDEGPGRRFFAALREGKGVDAR
ncbi:MAG: phosphoribosylformylglycinamidine synthase I [Candidatus Krumholzibacteria bacterium]|nr:phosphoribosylformylglycinamidine synthase I [Candidatus Krumholzibacteria bacterium]